jgi:Zn finger protein HypA/HybF involved in hydrogenase expression
MSHENKEYEVCEVCFHEVKHKGFASFCPQCEIVVEGATLFLTESEIEHAFELDEETEA